MKKFVDFFEGVSIACHGELNPKLWDGETLRPEVREALIKFGHTWREFAKIPESAVRDIYMVGGNASYCYNENSDIDVHLVVEREQLGFGPLVDEFLADRKALWSLKHAIRVRGYTLEPYAQDVTQPNPAGQGVYSLLNNSWVQKPIKIDYDPSQDKNLDRKIGHWKGTIDKAITEKRTADELRALKARIAEMRKIGLSKSGEFSPENLIFKTLRNDGYLQKMTDHIRDLEDRSLSLK